VEELGLDSVSEAELLAESLKKIQYFIRGAESALPGVRSQIIGKVLESLPEHYRTASMAEKITVSFDAAKKWPF
jgi:hypothetical protein